MSRRTISTLETFRDLKSDYAAATPGRFRRTRSGLYGSGDSHYASEAAFIRTREYSRDMDRNDAIIGPTVNIATNNQVQGGFIYEPQTGDDALDKDLRQDMHEWASDPDACDIAGENTLVQFESLGVRSEIVDGDIFLLGLDSGHLQAAEAHLCRTPSNTKKNVVHGVLLDSGDRPRRRLQYWFCPDNINPMQRFERVSDARMIDARDPQTGLKQVFQLYRPNRFSQTRGVIWCHAIFDKLGMIEDTDFAQVVKQQLAACLAWSWKKTAEYSSGIAPVTGEQTTEQMADGTQMLNQGVSPGQMLNPPKGMELVMHSPTIPTVESMEHMRRQLQLVMIQLGLPLFMGMLDGKEGSFSSLRTVFDQAKIGFRTNQTRRKGQFYVPMTKWRITHRMSKEPALRNAAEKSDIRIFNHIWNAPSWPYIQPLHDVQTDALRLTNCLASPTMLAAEDGRNFHNIIRECVRDNGDAIELAMVRAKEINDKYGEGKKIVTWRDILNRDMPKGDQLVIGESQDQLSDAGSSGGGSEPSAPAKRGK